jgi:hypothetical protein
VEKATATFQPDWKGLSIIWAFTFRAERGRASIPANWLSRAKNALRAPQLDLSQAAPSGLNFERNVAQAAPEWPDAAKPLPASVPNPHPKVY